MAKPSSSKPISTHRKAFYILGSILLGIIFVYVSYAYITHQQALSSEEKSFMALRQDMLNLQKEFNKVDSGWKYSEGCRDDGQVYSQGQISSCYAELNSKNLTPINTSVVQMQKYLVAVKDRGFHIGQLVMTNPQEYYAEGTSPDRKMNCVINFNIIKIMNTMTCSGEAHKEYFKYNGK